MKHINKIIKLQLKILLFVTSTAVLGFLLLFNSYYETSDVLPPFILFILIPGLIFSLFFYSFKKIITFIKSEKLNDYKFRIILIQIIIILAELGSLFLGAIFFHSVITDPTNTEAASGIAILFITFAPVFAIVTFILWFIGLFLDKNITKMNRNKYIFPLYSLIFFLGPFCSSLLLTVIHPILYGILSYFIVFIGVTIILITFAVGFFLDTKKKSRLKITFSTKKITQSLLLLSFIQITLSLIVITFWTYNENLYVNELENKYIGLSKQELLLKLKERKINECPIGKTGDSITVTEGMTEKMSKTTVWNWDCYNDNDKKHGHRMYRFVFNDEMIVEKVTISRLFDGP